MRESLRLLVPVRGDEEIAGESCAVTLDDRGGRGERERDVERELEEDLIGRDPGWGRLRERRLVSTGPVPGHAGGGSGGPISWRVIGSLDLRLGLASLTTEPEAMERGSPTGRRNEFGLDVAEAERGIR
jgi:hypothetical protein